MTFRGSRKSNRVGAEMMMEKVAMFSTEKITRNSRSSTIATKVQSSEICH